MPTYPNPHEATMSTLLSNVPDDIQAALTLHNLRLAGIDEAPLPLMQHERFLQITAHLKELTPPMRALKNSLSSQASQARSRLKHSSLLADYYTRRQIARDIGQNPDTVMRVDARNQRALRAAEKTLTPRQQLELRAAEEILTQEQWAAANGEQMASPVDRSPWAVAQRREYTLHVKRVTDARAQLAKDVQDKELEREQLAAKFSNVYTECPAPAVTRAAAYHAMTVPDRVLHDLDTIARMGRPIPVASSHPQGGTPLWLRHGLR